jgi:hypothetical protein
MFNWILEIFFTNFGNFFKNKSFKPFDYGRKNKILG